jgi:hypothetical protein
MLKTKLSLERLEDRDAPSGIDPSPGGGDPTTPPPTDGTPVTVQPSPGH